MVRSDAGVTARKWRDNNQKKRVQEGMDKARKAQRKQRDSL